MVQEFIIVDEEDNIIGHKTRDAIRQEDIYRVSGLWITNSLGDVLLARRALIKSHDPGKWGPAVAGTVEEGESYEANIVKEAEEEIGLKGADFKLGPKVKVIGEHNYFVQWYVAKVDKPESSFILKPDEVEEVKWFSCTDLKRELEVSPDKFIKTMERWTKLFCQ